MVSGMTDTPHDKPAPTTDAQRRAVMNDLLKKHTVCDQLVLFSQTPQELMRSTGADCNNEVMCRDPNKALPDIHDAINRQAKEDAQKLRARRGLGAITTLLAENGIPGLPPVDEKSIRLEYYKAADQILGLDKGFRRPTDEPAPDHKLSCSPLAGVDEPSITTVINCKKDSPKPRGR
jgi:hypothetical protein